MILMLLTVFVVYSFLILYKYCLQISLNMFVKEQETTDGLLKKMGARKPTKPGYEYMTSTLGFDFHSLHFVH